MNKRMATTVAAFATLAGAAGFAWTSTTGGAAAAGAGEPHGRTLVVVEHAVHETTVDEGPKGDSRGDQLAFANPVYDARNKTKVGDDLGSCVRTTPGVAYECTWTLRIHGGSLVVTGPFLDSGDSTLAITGGTGKFAGASGSMKLHANNRAGTTYRFTYHLR